MRKPGYRVGVLTFANHPAAFLRPGTEPPLITTTAERIDLFAQAGFEECFVIQFDDSIATLTPQQFLERLTAMGVRGVAVGSTFRFGHKRAGDAAMMGAYFAERNVPFVGLENVAGRFRPFPSRDAHNSRGHMAAVIAWRIRERYVMRHFFRTAERAGRRRAPGPARISRT